MGKGLKELPGRMKILSLWGAYTGVYIVSIQTEYLRSMYFIKTQMLPQKCSLDKTVDSKL